MTLLDRIFLAISAVMMMVLAGLLFATMLGSSLVIDWLESANLLFDGSILAVILLLLAVYLVVMITRFERMKYIVYSRELGAVKISADCVESLIIEAAEQVQGLEQVRARIIDVLEPKVALKIAVYPDYNIPQLSTDLQENVKTYVEKTVGVVIKEIEVCVVGISKKNQADLDALV